MSADSVLALKLNSFIKLSLKERLYLEELQSYCRIFKVPIELVKDGQRCRTAFILQEGWGYSYKLLADGRRQIISFYVPGDIIGFPSILMPVSPCFSETLTPASISEVSIASILQIFDDMPRLGWALLWTAFRYEAIMVEHLVDLGRRSAMERMAHLFLELSYRLRLIGHASELSFACPLTQEVLADALGLSIVHVNRVLRQLRERGLASLKCGRLSIRDTAGLKRVAAFDESYLDQNDNQEQVVAKKLFLPLDL